MVFYIFFIFLLFSWYVGTEYRREGLDFESDITVMRALKGDFWSVLISNASPTTHYSIPYGGWPPLHTIIHYFFAILGLSIPFARLITNILLIISFGIIVMVIVKKISQSADHILALMLAILSPALVNQISLGVRHIIIPFAAVIPLLLLIYFRASYIYYVITAFICFIIGFSDWHAYSFLFALTFILLVSIIFPINSFFKNIDKRELIYFLIISGSGFLSAFILYKYLYYWYISKNLINSLFIIEGASINKLFYQTQLSGKILLMAIVFTLVRIGFASLPLLFIIIFIIYNNKGQIKIEKDRLSILILLLSIIAPILFSLIFRSQVHQPYHDFEILAFIALVALISSQLYIPQRNKNLVRIFSILLIVLLNIIFLNLWRILPDKYLISHQYSNQQLYHLPLEPGDYDISSTTSQINEVIIIKSILRQIASLPINDNRLIKLNPYFGSINYFRIYADDLKKEIMEDEIIIIYGKKNWWELSYSFFTERVFMGVANKLQFQKLVRDLKNKYGDNIKIALIIPKKPII